MFTPLFSGPGTISSHDEKKTGCGKARWTGGSNLDDMIHRVGIHSLVFRAIMARFFESEKAKERFALEKEQIAHAGSFVKSDEQRAMGVICSWA